MFKYGKRLVSKLSASLSLSLRTPARTNNNNHHHHDSTCSSDNSYININNNDTASNDNPYDHANVDSYIANDNCNHSEQSSHSMVVQQQQVPVVPVPPPAVAVAADDTTTTAATSTSSGTPSSNSTSATTSSSTGTTITTRTGSMNTAAGNHYHHHHQYRYCYDDGDNNNTTTTSTTNATIATNATNNTIFTATTRPTGTATWDVTPTTTTTTTIGGRRKKRSRDAITNHSGHKTPMLLIEPKKHNQQIIIMNNYHNLHHHQKRAKKSGVIGQSQSLLLQMLPHDVLSSHILSFVTPNPHDYFNIQLTCKEFKNLSNHLGILKHIHINGIGMTNAFASVDRTDTTTIDNDLNSDNNTTNNNDNNNNSNYQLRVEKGILYNVQSPVIAIQRLHKFASAGNLQALYMTGMIAAYCHGDRIGVQLLQLTSHLGCLRSSYALGIILRDFNKPLSEQYLQSAIQRNYLPACQELLSSQHVKDKFGELGPQTLQQFFDPKGLTQLLSKCYLQSHGVRGVATSHCWNPCCGRWALKATQSNDGRNTPQLSCPSKCLPPLDIQSETLLIDLVHTLLNRMNNMSNNSNINNRHNIGASTTATSTIHSKHKNEQNDHSHTHLHGDFMESSFFDFEMSDAEKTNNNNYHDEHENEDDYNNDAHNNDRQVHFDDENKHYENNSSITESQGREQMNNNNASETVTASSAITKTTHNKNYNQLVAGARRGRQSLRVSRMKMCSSCRRAKYCSKLCQVYDWRSGRHKLECQYL